MKAVVYRRHGPVDVLQIEEIETPVPADEEVLIRIRAASVNPLDWRLMIGKPAIIRLVFMRRKKKFKRPGVDFAGTIEAVGGAVTQFKPGDAVYGSCRGAFAEYAIAPQSAVAMKPANMTFEQAAAVPMTGYTALQALRDTGRLRSGQKVLINGAAGGIGSIAVQIAKSFGAEVTGVCSPKSVDMVRSIGADRVIDYTRDDFTRSGDQYDLIIDIVGNRSLSAFRRALKPHGVYVAVGGPQGSWVAFLGRLLAIPIRSRLSSRKLRIMMAKRSQEDLNLLRELMEAGKVTPVIDRRYQLGEIRDAFRYMQEGHARGKVVVAVE